MSNQAPPADSELGLRSLKFISQKTAISPEMPKYMQTKHVPLTKIDTKQLKKADLKIVQNRNSNC